MLIPTKFPLTPNNLSMTRPAVNKKKSPEDNSSGLLTKMADTYSPTFAVPSARTGLTSLFGMGRGGTPSL